MKFPLLLFFVVAGIVKGWSQKTDTSYIYFPFNSYQLTTSAKQQLHTFLEKYRKQPADITLFGHCDSLGSNNYNDQLSVNRTAAIKSWLLEKGVGNENIVLEKGFGKRAPLNNNASPQDRSKNRRVEIILETNQPTATADTVKSFYQKAIATLQQGEKLVLPQINFQGGLHRFMPGSMNSLEQLLNIMQTHAGLEIEIQGHICCRPGEDLDGIDLETNRYDLSENRAKAVYEYLWEHGIDKKRMRYKGMAGRFPLVWPENSEADRTTNRRVEILILKK
jgi:outer membrane protein OmpA-like peptidoglycan-associated protein